MIKASEARKNLETKIFFEKINYLNTINSMIILTISNTYHRFCCFKNHDIKEITIAAINELKRNGYNVEYDDNGFRVSW